MSKNSLNRRDFLSSAAVVGATGAIGAGPLLTSCGGPKEPPLVPLRPQSEWNIPSDPLPDRAIDGRELKVGLVGCGGQGTGDLMSLLSVADNIKVVALGDTFQDRINGCRRQLSERYNQTVPDEMCFIGFDAYQKVINAGIDMVMLITPPAFRPAQFKAAVDAGVHVFMEKPMAVDPVGVRAILMAARQAEQQRLCVINGTQRRHARRYVEAYKLVQSGLIGDIVSANVYWNQQKLWHRDKDPRWTDMEWMVRDWVNWNWLSGDHITEQHIHNIDVFHWFSHLTPVRCVGFGARQRRPTGDQFDMFSVDYIYEGGVHVHSMCRQIDGTHGNVSERIQGTKGVWSSNGRITDLQGNELWRFDREKEEEEYEVRNEFQLQFVNWVTRIRNNDPINQAEETAHSTLAAIMGRISAYTGAQVTWEEVMAMDLDIVPTDLSLRNMDLSQFPVPTPGRGPNDPRPEQQRRRT